MNRKTVFAEGEYYHVYNRGVEKRTIFLDDMDRRRFQALLYLCNGEKSIVYRLIQGETLYQTEVEEKKCAIGAYALMDNHFHILLREIKENGISEFMQKLTTSYSMYFNKKNQRVGALFQGVFKAEHVDRDEYLKYLYAYIHLNPVKLFDPHWRDEGVRDRVGTKNFLDQYTHSSYPDYQGETREENVILSTAEFPEYFETTREFDELVSYWLDYESSEEI